MSAVPYFPDDLSLGSGVAAPIEGQSEPDYFLDDLTPLLEYPVVDVEFHEDGYAIWQDETGFYFATVDMTTGEIDEILHVADDIPPIQVVAGTWQGPEFLRMEDGLIAVGTSEEGLVIFSATDSYLIPDSEGLILRFVPTVEMTELRFNAYDPVTGQHYLYEDGSFQPLDIEQEWLRWLSTDEVLVQTETGYEIYNIDTEESVVVAEGDYKAIHHFALEMSDGERLVLLASADGGYSDLYLETDDGWVLVDQVTSPIDVLTEIYSPEFVEWQGRVWISAYVGGPTFNSPSVQVLYDVENQEWHKLSTIDQKYKDQEAVPLDNGQLAIYVTDFDDNITLFQVLDPEGDPNADLRLDVGAPQLSLFSSRYMRVEDEDGVITISFLGTGEDLTLNLAVYDIDELGELEVSLNGVEIDPVGATGDGEVGIASITLEDEFVFVGWNTIEITPSDPENSWILFGFYLDDEPNAENQRIVESHQFSDEFLFEKSLFVQEGEDSYLL